MNVTPEIYKTMFIAFTKHEYDYEKGCSIWTQIK